MLYTEMIRRSYSPEFERMRDWLLSACGDLEKANRAVQELKTNPHLFDGIPPEERGALATVIHDLYRRRAEYLREAAEARQPAPR
ncbi:hypothetical protein [Calidithermus chliarophilus]|uniref:hypothetical protein n=1 Tax=Calidithermus chliarophilus TaxID=52023 RepID=UPI00042907E2|nr:hypothetical protein [Calidithermus chliarophilus]